VKEMLLQELINLAIVTEVTAALPNMLGPVATSVLNFRRKTLLNSAALDIGYKHTRSIHATDVLPE
jgi:hypothetical protein